MPKAEISWKRVTEDGEKLQVYAQHVGREWQFFHRAKRFDVWQRGRRSRRWKTGWNCSTPCSGSSTAAVTSRTTRNGCAPRSAKNFPRRKFEFDCQPWHRPWKKSRAGTRLGRRKVG